MNEISNNKVASSSLLRLQKTASSLDSRFADHPHTQIVPTLNAFWHSHPYILGHFFEMFLIATCFRGFWLLAVFIDKITCNRKMLAFILQKFLSSFICNSLEARPSMLTASQRLQTDNSYHVATASLLASFPGFGAFQCQRRGSL